MSTALYRRYRPDTFADVIGQEHVTEPLVAAIDSGRINHAYLFSGPRGCGKTTSARIFARCLNCAQGPTGSPCGVCDSCVELARGGSGSLDVVELDAASHGGVDDARDLRERAIFAPARDRYKIFIIDEAHMVTTQGFNALLKLVEEPPEHVKFVFATTEPEKVIGTIRSRTHHYPFRLVPPDRLSSYLSELSRAEEIRFDDGVIPLVVRAGAGSVRDSLSVLDQLMAGALDGVVSYDRAVALLGYTPEGLLDDVVAALAAQDGAGLFSVVEQVISSGHDPRRFAEDLLERFRDLIVVLAAGEGARAVLPQVSADQLDRMRTQAGHLGAATCSRAADLVHEALGQMVGATSPRLQLELLCARLLLPTAEEGVRALAVRLDRIEAAGPAQRGQSVPAAPSAPAEHVSPVRPDDRTQPPSPGREPVQSEQPEAPARSAWQAAARAHSEMAPTEPAPGEPAQTGAAASDGWPSVQVPGHAPADEAPPTPPAEPQQQQERPPAVSPSPSGPAPSEGGGLNVQQLRNRWPEVLQSLARLKRSSWALVAQDAQVVDLQPDVLTVGFSTTGLASAFQAGSHAESLSRALAETLGMQLRIETTIVGSSGRSAPPAAPAPPPPQAQTQPAPPNSPPPTSAQSPQTRTTRAETPQASPPSTSREPEGRGQTGPEPPSGSQAPPSPRESAERAGGAATGPATSHGAQAAAVAPPAEQPAPVGDLPPWADVPPSEPPDDYHDYSPDDAEIGGSDLVGPPLIAKMLGGTVIDEIVEE